MLWLQLSIMQIWLPELGLIEKLFRVFEASFSSIDDLKKKYMEFNICMHLRF